MSGINDLWSELCDEGLALSDHSSEHVSKIMGIMEKHLFYAFDDGRRSAIEECAERFTQFDIDRIRMDVGRTPTEVLRRWAGRLHDMQPNSHYHADCIEFELAEIGRVIERRTLQDLELDRKRYEARAGAS